MATPAKSTATKSAKSTATKPPHAVFAARLRTARAAMRLTQAELARKVEVASATVTQWERGESFPRWGRLKDLKQALGRHWGSPRNAESLAHWVNANVVDAGKPQQRLNYQPVIGPSGPRVDLVAPSGPHKEFALRLRQARMAAKFTQADLATRLGINVGAVGQWDRGNALPKPRHAIALKEILGKHWGTADNPNSLAAWWEEFHQAHEAVHAPRPRYGPLLRAARLAAGLSEDDVAKHLGVSTQKLRAWEEGWRNPRKPQKRRLEILLPTLRTAVRVTSTPGEAATATATFFVAVQDALAKHQLTVKQVGELHATLNRMVEAAKPA